VPWLKSHMEESILSTIFNSRLSTILRTTLPNTVLVILLPVGILGVIDLPCLLVWSVLPIFLGAYSLFSFFLPHYALATCLPVALMLILGIRAVADTWPVQRRVVGAMLILLAASFAITALPGLRSSGRDQDGWWPLMTAVHKLLPKAVRVPAVVLFPYHLGDNPHEEPVYNIDVAWPDDAPIIHAQDLGLERNQEIAAYYAKIQPDRNFYLFDRRNYSLHFLGKPDAFLSDLRAKLAEKVATDPASHSATTP